MECLFAPRALCIGLILGSLILGTPAAATRACEFDGGFRPRSSGRTGSHAVRLLTDVRSGAHRCFDRAAFEFRPDEGGGIGFRAGYEAEPIREDGSGRRVAVAGREVIVVRLSPARDVEFDGDGRAERTYHGPAAVEPRGGRRIVEVRHISSFEGTVKWAIGIDRRRPFRVATLSSPPRLVIDVGSER